jgi:2-amino-4-hydroxy-6-hydroxymethyldihydropteridine diphosphokinase
VGNLRRAIERLPTEGLEICQVSSVFESTPLGPVIEQPDFYNLVIEVRCALEPLVLLDHCLDVERQLGRVRRNCKGPREIDIDLLLLGTELVALPALTIPHPEYRRRAFVLEPLCEVAPQICDPRDGAALALLLPRLRCKQALRRVGPIADLVRYDSLGQRERLGAGMR